MATTLRPDRGFPIEIGGITFHFLYTFAVIDDLQTFFDAPMSEILDKLTTDRTFYATAGHMIEALIRNDLVNNGYDGTSPTYSQIMHVLTIRDTERIMRTLFESYTKDMPDKDDDEDDTHEDPQRINIARLLIIAKTEMHMSEDEFWRTTPRKYFALFDEYIKLKSGGKSSDGGGIDDLP